DFVSFLDSADGINYPMYTPRVDLAPGQSCDQPDPFAGGTVTYEDSTTGFRAGWKSTSIRCRGDSLVYHDVSVVYLAALNRYLMFAVECDGESMGLSGENLSETDDCSICVPGICLQGGTPKTRFVFFTCADPDFQSGTMGPFPACPTPPDPTAMPAQWIGVPQAFMSPDENFLLFYIGGAAYMYAGMHVARVRSLQQGIQDLEDAWSRGDDVSEMGHDSFYQYFENLGICNVACNTPSSPCQGAGGSGDCAANASPTLTDEHFVFCEDGYLHLYFTNRNPQNDSEAASGTNLPLTLVSHAVAAGPWDALSVRSLLTGRPLFGGANFSGGSGLEVGYEFTTKDMLANFTMVDCDPVDMVALLGAEQIETPFGQETLVINDPNVYQAAKGDYVMIAHSQAMGGLLRFKATSRVACRSVYQC
ncbi:MAG TPA: hypothetical protein PKY30_10210, partial [Myxococcota bacterium]|nr:hypothetical protein [Myxococcota bacterium]